MSVLQVTALKRSDSPKDLGCPQMSNGEARPFLNHLRFVALRCRVMPRTTLFEACALLQIEKSARRTSHAESLMRCIDEALGRRVWLFAPGTLEITFDEAWLVQLACATARQDADSMDFLLRSRVAPEHRRLVRFLVSRITDCFSPN